MKLSSFTYERTVNLGNYESAKFAVTVELEADTKFAEARNKAIKTVDKCVELEVIQNSLVKRNDKGARSNG